MGGPREEGGRAQGGRWAGRQCRELITLTPLADLISPSDHCGDNFSKSVNLKFNIEEFHPRCSPCPEQTQTIVILLKTVYGGYPR